MIDSEIYVLCSSRSEEIIYAFYWNCDFPIKTAMLFFTKDGNLIVGLAVYEPHVQSFYQKMLLSVRGVCGYVQNAQEESPPPNCKNDFIKRVDYYRKAN